MQELLRSNDPVLLSWIAALLADAGIDAVILDHHASVLEGSAAAIPRRVMVGEEDLEAARRLLDASRREFAHE